jgi:hypothetical protein
MRLHHLTVWVAALLAVVALASGGMASAAARRGAAAAVESPTATATHTATATPTMTASPTATATATHTATATPTVTARAKVTETAKVTLRDTSIAGPGFSAGVDIAWTGTDDDHHLNLRRGTDGLHFPSKFIFPETSPVGPSVLEGPIPGAADHTSSLAWTGTDADHHVNVEFGSPFGTKLTLHETSFAAPAISFGTSTHEWLVAWTGTDANHSLNVLSITSSSAGTPVVGRKTVLTQFSSDAGPSLVGGATSVVLGWSVRGTQRLNLAESTDGVHFTSALGSGLPQTSAEAPQFLQTGSSSGCIAWTGTDSTNHLNVQCTTQLPQFPNPAQTKTVLPETALGAPGIFAASVNVPGIPPFEIAWTGTDAAHHLNVDQASGF